MNIISLNGPWELNDDAFKNVAATVPGCVHTDLMSAGLIPDPFYRDNELGLMWIGQSDWEYSRCFKITDELFVNKQIVLQCAGLDTYAHVLINGTEVAATDNMFRNWEFDIKELLILGENQIKILFKSTYPVMESKSRERWLWITGLNHHRIDGNSWIRKMQCNYGWDWGPMCVTCGIWRDIQIAACDVARISDVLISQTHSPEKVDLKFNISLEKISRQPVNIKVDLLFNGTVAGTINSATEGSDFTASMTVNQPQLWWPNNLGQQNLYDVVVSILQNDVVLDAWQREIGLRILKLDRHPDAWGESFQFTVNGKPFFAKGANWIPADTFVIRCSDAFYEQLVKDVAAANMNFLRVWGGGIYERDIFYQTCDRLGICVWQDFMFACSAYPAFDPDFMGSVRQEAIDNVRRLRHHACMALLCGNNEIEIFKNCVSDEGIYGSISWHEYDQLFNQLLPDVVKAYSPEIDYWPSSPHTPNKNTDGSKSGDAHLWDVWHGRKPFEWYRTCEHRFNSEFGFQSFPEPRIVESYTLPEDRNVTSYIMEHHQRSGIGNDAIIQNMLAWFKLPGSFDMLLWLSQILQGIAMKYAVELWRRSMPRGMGTLYWQINDCWPAPSWSSIDYLGNWKALQYMAREFFKPVLISCVEDIDNLTAEVHLTNDNFYPISGAANWKLITVQGEIAAQGEFDTEMQASSTALIQILNMQNIIKEHGPRNVMLYTSFSMNGQKVSENLAFFCRPKHLNLVSPIIDKKIEPVDDRHYSIEILTHVPALWGWIDLQGVATRISDNFFHISPKISKRIIIKVQSDLTMERIESAFKCHCLIDSYYS